MFGERTKFLFLSTMMALSTNVAAHAHSIPMAKPQPAGPQKIASACLQRMGQAAGGQTILLNVCSIKHEQGFYNSFIYYLGREKISSLADCRSLSWITYPEQQRHYPRSAATDLMVRTVCQ